MKLTKHSERNLNVITNFLIHIGLEEKYQDVAFQYILEDHVDGEGSEQALLERAYDSELIIEESYETNDLDELNPINYYADEDGLIYSVSLNDEKVEVYRLTKPQEVIEVEHRDEILTYNLSRKYTEYDEVYLRDIISHGKYIEKIYPI